MSFNKGFKKHNPFSQSQYYVQDRLNNPKKYDKTYQKKESERRKNVYKQRIASEKALDIQYQKWKNKKTSTPSYGLSNISRVADVQNEIKYGPTPRYTSAKESDYDNYKKPSFVHQTIENYKKIYRVNPELAHEYMTNSYGSYFETQYALNRKKAFDEEVRHAQENFKRIESRRKSWEESHQKPIKTNSPAISKTPKYHPKSNVQKTYRVEPSYAPKDEVSSLYNKAKKISYSDYGANYRPPDKLKFGQRVEDFATKYGVGKLPKEKVVGIKKLLNGIKSIFKSSKQKQLEFAIDDKTLKQLTASAGVSDVKIGDWQSIANQYAKQYEEFNKKSHPITKALSNSPDNLIPDLDLKSINKIANNVKKKIDSRLKENPFSTTDKLIEIRKNDEVKDALISSILEQTKDLTGVDVNKSDYKNYWDNLDFGDKLGMVLGLGQPFIRDLIGSVVKAVKENGLDFNKVRKATRDNLLSGAGKKEAYDWVNWKIGNVDIGDLAVDVITDPLAITGLLKAGVLNVGKALGKDTSKGIYKGITTLAKNVNYVNDIIAQPLEYSFKKVFSLLRKNPVIEYLTEPKSFIQKAIKGGKQFVDDLVNKFDLKTHIGDDGVKVLEKKVVETRKEVLKNVEAFVSVKKLFQKKIGEYVKAVQKVGGNITDFANMMISRDGIEEYAKKHNVPESLVKVAKELRKDLDTLVKESGGKIKYRKGYLPEKLRLPDNIYEKIGSPEFKEYWTNPRKYLEHQEFVALTPEKFQEVLANRFALQIAGPNLQKIEKIATTFTSELKQIVELPKVIYNTLLSGKEIASNISESFMKDISKSEFGKLVSKYRITKKLLGKEAKKLAEELSASKVPYSEFLKIYQKDIPERYLKKYADKFGFDEKLVKKVIDFKNRIKKVYSYVDNKVNLEKANNTDISELINDIKKWKPITYQTDIPKNVNKSDFIDYLIDDYAAKDGKKLLRDYMQIKHGNLFDVKLEHIFDTMAKDVPLGKLPTPEKPLDKFSSLLLLDKDIFNQFTNYVSKNATEMLTKFDFSKDIIPTIFKTEFNPEKVSLIRKVLNPIKIAGKIYDSSLKLWKDSVLIGRPTGWAVKNLIDDVVKPLIETFDSFMEGRPLNIFTKSFKNMGYHKIDDVYKQLSKGFIPEQYYRKIIGEGLYELEGSAGYFTNALQNIKSDKLKALAGLYDDITGKLYSIFGKVEHVTRLKYGSMLLKSKLKALGKDYTSVQAKKILNEVIDEVNKVFFSYEKTPIDKGLEKVMPFFYWNRENLKYFGEKFSKYPYVLTNLVRLKTKIETANKGLPPRVRDKIKVPLGIIENAISDIGQVYIDPINLFSWNFVSKMYESEPGYITKKKQLLEEKYQEWLKSSDENKKYLIAKYPELNPYISEKRLSGVKKFVDFVDNMFGIYPVVRYLGEYVGVANPDNYKDFLPWSNVINAIFDTNIGLKPEYRKYNESKRKREILKLSSLYNGDLEKAKKVYQMKQIFEQLGGFMTGIYPKTLNKEELDLYKLSQVAYGNDPVVLKENYILSNIPKIGNSAIFSGEDLGDGYFRLKANLINQYKPKESSNIVNEKVYHLDDVIDYSQWIIDNDNLALHLPETQTGEYPTVEKVQRVISSPINEPIIKITPVVKQIVNSNPQFFKNIKYPDNVKVKSTEYSNAKSKLDNEYLDGKIDEKSYNEKLKDLIIKYNVEDDAKKFLMSTYVTLNKASAQRKFDILYDDVKNGKIKTPEDLYQVLVDNKLIVKKNDIPISLLSKKQVDTLLDIINSQSEKTQKKQYFEIINKIKDLKDNMKYDEALELWSESQPLFANAGKEQREYFNRLLKGINYGKASEYFDLPDEEKIKVYEKDKSYLRQIMSKSQFKVFSNMVEKIKSREQFNKFNDADLEYIVEHKDEFMNIPEKYHFIVISKLRDEIKKNPNNVVYISKLSELIPESEVNNLIKPIAYDYMHKRWQGEDVVPIKIKYGDKDIIINDKYINTHYDSNFVDSVIQKQLAIEKKSYYPKYQILKDNDYNIEKVISEKKLTKDDIDKIKEFFPWVKTEIPRYEEIRQFNSYIAKLYGKKYNEKKEIYSKFPQWVKDKFKSKYGFEYK